MIGESNFDEPLFIQMNLEGALIETYTKKQYDIIKSWNYETLKQVNINEFGKIVKSKEDINNNPKIKFSYMFKKF